LLIPLKRGDALSNGGPKVDVADRDDTEAFIASPRLEVYGMKNCRYAGGTTSRSMNELYLSARKIGRDEGERQAFALLDFLHPPLEYGKCSSEAAFLFASSPRSTASVA